MPSVTVREAIRHSGRQFILSTDGTLLVHSSIVEWPTLFVKMVRAKGIINFLGIDFSGMEWTISD